MPQTAFAFLTAFACGFALVLIRTQHSQSALSESSTTPQDPDWQQEYLLHSPAGAPATTGSDPLGPSHPLTPSHTNSSPQQLSPAHIQPRRRIALLHKAHATLTLRGLHAALSAKEEVESAGGWYGFLFSQHPERLAADGQPRGLQQRLSLEMLRRVLGNGSVAVVGRGEVEGALGQGLLEAQRRVIGEREWAWVTNDVVDVTW